MGFLKGRKLQVKFKGKTSKLMDMPGGGPAGTILGMWVFIILVNPVEFTQKLHLGTQITQKLPKRMPMEKLHLKYFDDVSLLEALNLKESLKNEERALERPLNFHQRTGHVICEEKFQTLQKVKDVQIFTKNSEMVLNSAKTKVMIFNKSLHYDFMPEIEICPGEKLQVVEEYKILGVIFSTDMKWSKHINYVCKRAYTQLWTLRRLKKLGANQKILIDIYDKYVRSILEYAAPAWYPMVTLENTADLERVQKCAYSIIFGPNSYQKSLDSQNKTRLGDRLLKLSTQFALKCESNPICIEWFCEKEKLVNTRSKIKYNEIPFRCDRWSRSPIPFITKILNDKTS